MIDSGIKDLEDHGKKNKPIKQKNPALITQSGISFFRRTQLSQLSFQFIRQYVLRNCTYLLIYYFTIFKEQ